jgi:cytidine deaminase
MITPQLRQELIRVALEVRQRAYTPYSHYQVGAALLSADGTIFSGCNIENAAYSPCICAERSALAKAVSEGVRQFTAIAVATHNVGAPCGVCRQSLYEFSPTMLVILADAEGKVHHELPLSDLLPLGFGPSFLGL